MKMCTFNMHLMIEDLGEFELTCRRSYRVRCGGESAGGAGRGGKLVVIIWYLLLDVSFVLKLGNAIKACIAGFWNNFGIILRHLIYIDCKVKLWNGFEDLLFIFIR